MRIKHILVHQHQVDERILIFSHSSLHHPVNKSAGRIAITLSDETPGICHGLCTILAHHLYHAMVSLQVWIQEVKGPWNTCSKG